MNKKTIGYIITFILSTAMVLFAVCTLVYLTNTKTEMRYQNIIDKAEQEHKKTKETFDPTEYRKELIRSIIKYEKELQQNPTDPGIHTQLGYLYDNLGVYEDAEKHFEAAILLSKYGLYKPYFDLANFYLRNNQLKLAQDSIERIVNKKKKLLQISKGDFYIKLGDSYSKIGDYQAAIKCGEKALEYYKAAKRIKLQNYAKSEIVYAYNAFAAHNIKENNLTGAVENLEASLKYKDSVVTNYKLAILYKDIDPLRAYLYMEKAFSQDPGYINFDVYQKIIFDVINYYEADGRKDEVALYRQKLKSVRKYEERYIITENDFSVVDEKTTVRNGVLGDRKIIVIKYNIKNNSHNKVNALFTQVNVTHRGRELVIDKNKLFSKKNLFKPGELSPPLSVEYGYFIYDKSNKEKVIFDFYVTRKSEIRKTKIHTLEFDE